MRDSTVVIMVGQFWHLLYNGERVRMRVANISRDGGVVLVEDKPRKDWIRVLSTSAASLYLVGELALPRGRVVEEDHGPEEVTQIELVRPVDDEEVH